MPQCILLIMGKTPPCTKNIHDGSPAVSQLYEIYMRCFRRTQRTTTERSRHRAIGNQRIGRYVTNVGTDADDDYDYVVVVVDSEGSQCAHRTLAKRPVGGVRLTFTHTHKHTDRIATIGQGAIAFVCKTDDDDDAAMLCVFVIISISIRRNIQRVCLWVTQQIRLIGKVFVRFIIPNKP